MGCGSSQSTGVQETRTVIIFVQKEPDNQVVTMARASGLSHAFVKQLHEYFYTVSPSGRMTPGQFAALFAVVHDQQNNALLVKFLIRLYLVFDTDQAGYIIFAEFIKIIAIIVRGSGAERFAVIYSLCDTDKGGTIERSEFLNTIKDLVAFIPGIANLNAMALMELADEAFDKMDTRKRNSVTVQDFVQALLIQGDEDVGRLVKLIFSALVRVITGDPPIPKQMPVMIMA